MPTQATLIPGDGIGPSISDATVRILAAAGADIEWDVQVAGQAGVTRWHDPMPEPTLESIALITRHGSERIVRYAFDYAVANGRKKVTLVHKANILKYSQGLFLDVGREIAKEYAGRVEFEEQIVDAMAMKLVLTPENFDVIVTTNLFGDILSDLISGL